jgi:hypothetical protein
MAAWLAKARDKGLGRHRGTSEVKVRVRSIQRSPGVATTAQRASARPGCRELAMTPMEMIRTATPRRERDLKPIDQTRHEQSASTLRVSVLLEEYRALRSEITTSITVQQTHLSFGGAIVGVTSFAAVSALQQCWGVSVVLFVVANPVVMFLTMIVWLSEVSRMFRVGRHLRRLELRINEELGGPELLQWENMVHNAYGRRGPENLQSLAIVACLSGLAVTSSAVGYALLFSRGHANPTLYALGTVGSAVFLVTAIWSSLVIEAGARKHMIART